MNGAQGRDGKNVYVFHAEAIRCQTIINGFNGKARIMFDSVKTFFRNIRNYSIYYKDGYLFAYFEYVGSDFDADMAKMAADETTQKWWAVCKPCQAPVENRAAGEWWADMEEVFHWD